jgi:hypothetical protein
MRLACRLKARAQHVAPRGRRMRCRRACLGFSYQCAQSRLPKDLPLHKAIAGEKQTTWRRILVRPREAATRP